MRVIGTVRGTRSGFAFLHPDEGGEDLFIPATALAGALHGDRVRATLVYRHPYDYRPEAQVEEILERPHPLFTGNVFRLGSAWFVRPDSPLLPERLRLRLGSAAGVAGEKILFRVEQRPDRDGAPLALFEDAVGDEADATLDPLVIAMEFGLAQRFSEAALAEAEERAFGGPDEEDARRVDFRDQFVITIDPEDAKDFDDAVAIEATADGGWELTVHIADVGFYVREGGELDREAAARGTSVYFPGAVRPMLPESISTLAASLAPEVDKRVLSVRLRFDRDGRRERSSVHRGWMRSRARLHYRQAQEILDQRQPAEPTLRGALAAMRDLARRLRGRRFAEGGFDLEVPETEMVLGPDGVPVRLFRHESMESHHLIEEFMIAANRAVGEWAFERGVPFLFRVHQEPDAQALARFEETALALLPGTAAIDLSSLPHLRRWLSRLPRTPLTRVVHRSFLQSMKKAIYAPVDLGHFGLGVRGYCHFTSPIRRYPDLFNHRRVKELLDGRLPGMDWEAAHQLGASSSRTEINAQEAEREMNRLKAVRFTERHLGMEADGVVTGVIPQGVFVELNELPIEGLITREALPAGVRFVGERLAWTHERSGWELRPGDPVRVQVVRADLRARRVTFNLLPSDNGRGRRRARSASAGPAAAGSRAGPRGRKRAGSSRSASGRPAAGGRRRAKGAKPRGRGRRSS